MNTTATLELRIHGGIHDGAHEALPDQDDCTIGTDAGCDFVLIDEGIAPRHLRLTRDSSGAWSQQAHDAPNPQPIAPGQWLPLGPVAVSVAAAGSLWPDAQALPIAVSAPAAAPAETVIDMPPEEAIEAAAPAPIPAMPAPRPGRPWPIKLAGALLLCLGLLVGAALWQLSRPPTPAAALPHTLVVDSAAQHAAITRVLRSLRLEEHATLAATPTGGWTVQAMMLEDDTLEALALALSRLDPKPGLRMTSGEDARNLVQEALIRLSGNGSTALQATHLGAGRIRIEGGMANATARAELLRQLQAELPAWLVLDNAITIPEERAQHLLADLQTHGLGHIQGQWSPGQGRLDIVAHIPPEHTARWERALLQAVQRQPGVPLHARLEHPAPLPPARLPFGVLAVVSGAQDYVVLNDGSKLLVEGRHHGWRLAAIHAHEAVFENNRTLRVSVPR